MPRRDLGLHARRRHQPRRPALAKIRPGRPAPAMGAGTVLNCRSNTALVPIPQVSPWKLRKMLLDVNVASAPPTPAAVVAEFRVSPAMSVFLETSTNSNPLKELATKTREALKCNGDLRARDVVG